MEEEATAEEEGVTEVEADSEEEEIAVRSAYS